MRGRTGRQATMLLGATPEAFIPQSHPIRRVCVLVDSVLDELAPQLSAMYAPDGRCSIPPEHLLKASLLMALYSTSASSANGCKSAIDGRTTRHPGYAVSLRIRKRIEECFGWMKTTGASRKLRYIGVARNQLWVTLVATAFNLVRMANIEVQLTG